MAGAAGGGLAGLGVLLMGIAYLLGDAIDNLGLATLIVGIAALALAYLLYRSGAQASGRAQDLFAGNPLVTGILAAAVGAALGSTIPVSRTEQEKLGGIGGKALDAANEGKEALTSQALEKKDELLEKADRKLQQSFEEQSRQGGGEGQQPGAENRPGGEAPFMLTEGTR